MTLQSNTPTKKHRFNASRLHLPGQAAFFIFESNKTYAVATQLLTRVVDSITELNADDAGCIAVSGSHGGLSSARYALAARPLLSVFNDAGGGLDNAGVAALDFLQSHGLAACTIAHSSARIGESQSTLATGTITGLNAQAVALGIQAGWRCQQAVDLLLTPYKGKI